VKKNADNYREVLIAEDSRTQGELLKNTLERHFYRVILTANGNEAFAAMGARKPLLVISDILMPEMNGYDLCRAIKESPQFGDVPVILLTALSHPENVIRGLECGADNFIVKPYDETYLLSRVEYTLANSRPSQDRAQEPGLEVILEGRRYTIHSDRRQILDLLLSTYEDAVRKNEELVQAKDELKIFSEKLEGKVQERTAALTETNQQLEVFCYSVAHDLRAPLRAMHAFSQALMEDYSQCLDETGRDFARRIQGAALRMDRIVSELLEFSRLSRVPLVFEQVNVNHCLERALMHLQSDIEERRAIIEVEEALPKVRANQAVLDTILINLIANAVKFVPTDLAPRVQVWAETKNRMVRLWVRDNGIGIAPEYHERIFGLFERLHHVNSYPGTGLGLAIAKKGIERMQGRVGVNSKPGAGSSFWIELPEAP
jgi:two-component system, sensor histidine kinase and response regulator